MSKLVFLVFALVILTTLLCNNSVCSQRESWKQSVVCGCRIHLNKTLRCPKENSPKTREEYNKVVKCICSNPKKYFKRISKKDAVKMCSSRVQASLPLSK